MLLESRFSIIVQKKVMLSFKVFKFLSNLSPFVCKQDILFHYPESQNFGKFKKIRGLFLTLSDLMPSVTGTELKT